MVQLKNIVLFKLHYVCINIINWWINEYLIFICENNLFSCINRFCPYIFFSYLEHQNFLSGIKWWNKSCVLISTLLLHTVKLKASLYMYDIYIATCLKINSV